MHDIPSDSSPEADESRAGRRHRLDVAAFPPPMICYRLMLKNGRTQRSRGALRWLLLAFFFTRGVVLLCVLPPFEGWDEYQHVAYVVHLVETGRDPIPGETHVPESLLRALASFPQSRSGVEQLGGIGVVGYDDYWRRTEPPIYISPPRPPLLYQAQHPSLYYRCAAGIFTVAGGTANLRSSVAALRLMNLVLASVALWLILGKIGQLCSDARHSCLLGLIVAANPLFLMNVVRVANDALALLLATIVILWLFDFGPQRLIRRSAAIGLMSALAVLAKVVNLALLPLVAGVMIFLACRRQISPARTVGAILSTGLAFFILTLPYFHGNVTRLGVLIPMQEHGPVEAGKDGGVSLIDALVNIKWQDEITRLWGRRTLWTGGWSFLAPPRALRHVYEWALLASLSGWVMLAFAGRREERFVLRPPHAATICLLVCLCYTAALAYHMVFSMLHWGAKLTNPWYAAAALPWYFVLVYQGGAAWSTRRIRFLLPSLIVALFILTEATGIFGVMIRAYAGLDAGWTAFERLARLQPAFLGTPTLMLSAAASIGLLGVLVFAWIRRLREQTTEIDRTET
jgi:hypothetical protein